MLAWAPNLKMQNNEEIRMRFVSQGTHEQQTKRRAAARYIGHVEGKSVKFRDRVHYDRLELRDLHGEEAISIESKETFTKNPALTTFAPLQ